MGATILKAMLILSAEPTRVLWLAAEVLINAPQLKIALLNITMSAKI
jgi:hypothetical protein